MSLLRNSSVILYHDLDTFVESTKNFAWSGDGGFVSGMIGSGNSAVTSNAIMYSGAASFGPSDKSVAHVLDKLEDGKMILVHSDSTDIYASVATVSSSGTSFGSGTLVEGSWPAYAAELDCTALTPSSVLYAHRDGVGYQGYCKVISISGTTIASTGTRAQFAVWPSYGPPNGGINTIRMTDSKVLILATSQEGANPGRIYGRVAEVSGTTISLGDALYSNENVPLPMKQAWNATGIDESTAIMCYNQSASTSGFSMIVNVSGNVVSFASGTKTSFTSDMDQYGFSCTMPTPSSIVCCYRSTGKRGKSVVGNVSGSTVTWGPVQQWSTEDFDGVTEGNFHLTSLSPTRVALSYEQTNVPGINGGKAVAGTIDGTSISWDGISFWHTEWDATHGPRNSWSEPIDDKHILIAYADRSIGDSGYVKVGYLGAGASMEAVSGSLYPSNSGQSHITASFWGLNPTSDSLALHIERDYCIDLASDNISLGSGTAIWNDAGIVDVMSSINDGLPHFLVTDFAYSGSNSWFLKTSVDGSGWVDHGLQNSGTQAIVSGSTNPKFSITADEPSDQWIDELTMWAGSGIGFEEFTDRELVSLYNLASIFDARMDTYQQPIMLQPNKAVYYHPMDTLEDSSGVDWVHGEHPAWSGLTESVAGQVRTGRVYESGATTYSSLSDAGSGSYGNLDGANRFTFACWAADVTGAGFEAGFGSGVAYDGQQTLQLSGDGTIQLYVGTGFGGTLSKVVSMPASGWHFYVLDAEWTGSDWTIRYSVDGASWTSAGTISKGPMVGSPPKTLVEITGPTTKIDEVAIWKDATLFTSTELERLYSFGSASGLGLDRYGTVYPFTQLAASGNLFIGGHQSSVASRDLFIVGPRWSAASGDLFSIGDADFAASGDLFITGPSLEYSSCSLFASGCIANATSGTRIDWLLKTHDYNPQIIGTLVSSSTSVTIEVWDITDGANTVMVLTDDACYAIGETNRWGWSTANLPTYQGYKKHYYYRMTSNIGDIFEGQLFLDVPERARWMHPSRYEEYIR